MISEHVQKRIDEINERMEKFPEFVQRDIEKGEQRVKLLRSFREAFKTIFKNEERWQNMTDEDMEK